jgi:glycine hydroxymethyltransferase
MNINFRDKKIKELIKKEVDRQKDGLVLIPSENYASPEVLFAMGTPLSNKYSEGYPGRRYYPGNKFVDEIEKEAILRAKRIFNAEHANVQPHSGSQANAAVYLALLKPGDNVLGMSLEAGGHLTHGSPVNFSGKIYNFSYYNVNPKTEIIDYNQVEKIALKFKPKIIVAGVTSYPREIDFKKFRKIADKVGAYLMGDIAHLAGLVIAGVHPHPFPFCDVVTLTTHKTLRGPRGGAILCKNKDRLDKKNNDLAKKIDNALFPGTQGGPLENVIAAKAVCFLEASKPSFKKYQKQIIKNARAMADEFKKNGIRVVSNGTDTHMVLIDISSFDVSSLGVQRELEKVCIYANRNTIPFEKRPFYDPSGIRLGVPAITSRGMKEKEVREITKIISSVIKDISNNKLKAEIAFRVKKLCRKFPIYEDVKF